MDPFVTAYLRNLFGLLGMLIGISLVYMLLLAGFALLLSRWWGGRVARAFWLSSVICLALVLISMPIFEGVAGLFRHDPPGVVGLYRPDWPAYALTVRTAFFVLYVFMILLSATVGYTMGQRIDRHGKSLSVAVVLVVLVFLILTLPIIDFANACIIGMPFVLPIRC